MKITAQMTTNLSGDLNEVDFTDITRAITDNATNALFLMDAGGFCTFLNPAAEEMFGYTLRELQEKPLHDYIHYAHPNGDVYPLEDCPIGKTVFSLQPLKRHEDVFIKKDKSMLPVRCSAKGLTNEGRLTGILLEVQDIREEKKAAFEIRESEQRYRDIAQHLEVLVQERTQELQRSNNDLLQFAHVASHDLKEPMRKVLFYTNRLQQMAAHKLVSDEQTCLIKIYNAGKRLNTMIDGILNSSATNGNTQNIETVDLKKLVQETLDDLEVLIDSKGAHIVYDELPKIKGAYVLLYQLFYNLINNALKFSRQNVRPEIFINASITGVHLNITIQDNGIGFDQKYAEQIFEPFTRLNAKDQFEGTGLGLSLCRRIVKRHNGTLTASNTPNGGACFTIQLPVELNVAFI